MTSHRPGDAGDELARLRAALSSAQAELARMRAEFEQFASLAAHDLQSPLRKLVSFAELLREDLGRELPPRAQQDLDFITGSALHMRTLLRDLRELSRVATRTLEPEMIPVEVCVEVALAGLAPRVRESGAAIGRDPLPTLVADRPLLEALYRRLLANALEFVADGDKPQVQLTAERESRGDGGGDGDGPWVLGVRDRGIGIDPAHAETIFHPFRRLHPAEDHPGTGMGLAIARRAVERHGGRLWLESSPGQGAHFRFTLAPPLGAAPSGPTSGPTPGPTSGPTPGPKGGER